MIRLIIALLGIFLFWLWLASPWAKRSKIIVSVLVAVAIVAVLVLENYRDKPREGLVAVDQLTICDINVEHRYRSDHSVALCLENQSEYELRRISFRVDASRCVPDKQTPCEVIDSATRDAVLTVAPMSKVTIGETLSFKRIAEGEPNLVWSAEVISVQAVR